MQVWFQNRRQNDRRKSRPLLPHELMPQLATSCHDTRHDMSDVDPMPLEGLSGVESRHEVKKVLATPLEPGAPEATPNKRSAESLDQSPIEASSSAHSRDRVKSSQTSTASQDLSQSKEFEVGLKEADSGTGEFGKQEVKTREEHMSHKRKRMLSESQAGNHDGTIALESGRSIRPMSRDQPSSFRLSMSLDGKARVTNGQDSPSPQKPRAGAPSMVSGRVSSLQRSKSAVGLSSMASTELASATGPRRNAFGRSRDARTWEFYCDNEERDELSAQAERERKGSAAGAISLIRSQSKNALVQKPTFNRRTALERKAQMLDAMKPSRQATQKPKLSRAVSSLARLQTENAPSDVKSKTETSKKDEYDQVESIFGSPSGDSDKENWVPGTQTSNVPRRRAVDAHHSRASVLKDNSQIPSHSTSLSAALASDGNCKRNSRQSLPNTDKENARPGPEELDEDVAAFMSGSTVPDQEEDLDCIQGLLSLSQGAWR